MASSTNYDSRAAITTITVEDAQRAAAAINKYMATWPPDSTGQESPFLGARVTFLRAYRNPSVPGGVAWVPGFDRPFYIGLLFWVDNQGVARRQSDATFTERDLYPPVDSTAGQKGGAA